MQNKEVQPTKLHILQGEDICLYNDLRLNLHDMEFCLRIIVANSILLRSNPEQTTAAQQDIRAALWISILIKYFSCFRSSASRITLKDDTVFRNDMVLKEAFKRLLSVRNKHIAHDENGMSQSTACVEVDNVSDRRAFRWMMVGNYFPGEDLDVIMALINKSIAHCKNQLSVLSVRIENQIAMLSAELIQQLPEWRFDPGPSMFRQSENRQRLDKVSLKSSVPKR